MSFVFRRFGNLPIDESTVRPRLLGRPCPRCGHREHAHDSHGCLASITLRVGKGATTDQCDCTLPNGKR